MWWEVVEGPGAGFAIGPVAVVEDQRFWLGFALGLKAIIASDGGEGAKKEVAGVGHDGGPAGSNFVAGLELIEFAEGMVDVGGGVKFLDVADENGGEVGLVEVTLVFGSVFGAKAGIQIGDGHATAAAARSALLTMGKGNGGNGGRRVVESHKSSFSA